MLEPIRLFEDRFGPIQYVMAPMAGITDVVFRTLIHSMGAQAVVSELVSAEGLVRMNQKTFDLIRYSQEERPVGIQIFGHEEKTLVEACKIVQDHGADFVDLNLGCPVKKVVCDGAGAAWLKEPVKLGKVLTAMKQALRIPLTIKIRTGWDEQSRNPLEIVKVAADAGVSWVAIHGRTRAQGYSGLADWELIREVAVHSPLPIIGNGDILTSGQAKRRIEQGYAHAVMIGRGALKNPWIFKEILSPEKVNYDFVKLVEDHIELALAHKERRRAFLSLKKFLAWYATGYRNASHFRAALFKTEDLDELRVIAREFFVETKFKPVDDGQPFLMGGHG